MHLLETSNAIQIATFFLMVLTFGLLEKFRPARELNIWKDLKVDTLSFALGVSLSMLCYTWTYNFCTIYFPSSAIKIWDTLGSLPSYLKIIFVIITVDFCLYWLHRAQHSTEFLWRTHVWHHSITELYWFSGFRTSFLHSLLYNIPQTVIPMFVFKLTPIEAGIGYSVGILVQFWEHTNIDVNIGFLKYIFITPAYHRVHHSINVRNTNYGTFFSIWDRIFGTYHNPNSVPKDVKLGLDEELTPGKVARMLTGL